MMRARGQPAARMAAIARNNIWLRSAPAGAPSRISSTTSADKPSRSRRRRQDRRRLSRRLCAGMFGDQRLDNRRDVGERLVDQNVLGNRDEAAGAAGINLDLLAVRPFRDHEMLLAGLRQADDTQSGMRRGDIDIGPGPLDQRLRPVGEHAGHRITAMVEVTGRDIGVSSDHDAYAVHARHPSASSYDPHVFGSDTDA